MFSGALKIWLQNNLYRDDRKSCSRQALLFIYEIQVLFIVFVIILGFHLFHFTEWKFRKNDEDRSPISKKLLQVFY